MAQLEFWAEPCGAGKRTKGAIEATNAAMLACEDSLYARLENDFLPANPEISSDDTREEYRVSIRLFSGWWHAQRGRWPREPDVDEISIGNFMTGTIADGRSPATANKHRANLRALVHFLSNRDLDVPRAPELKREVRTWRDHQVQALLDQCSQEVGYLGPYLASDFWTGLHLAFLATGGRLNAVLKVGRDDVDLDRFLIRLSAEEQKHKADETKRFMPEASEVFKRLLACHSGGLFDGFPVLERKPHKSDPGCTKKQFQRLYARVLERAGLPCGAKDKFHNLRRYVATKMFIETNSIQEVQRFLGHSDQSVTEHYIDKTQVPDQVQSACDALPRFTLGSGPRIFRAS